MYINPPPDPRQQNNRPANKLLDALHLIEHGAYVIPLCWSEQAGSLSCSCPHGHKEKRGEVNAQGVREDVRWKQVGKVPLVEWQRYQADPPDEDQVMDWWGQWPRANAAILLEPSGLLVIDIDSHAAEQEVRDLGIGGGAQVVRGGKLKHIYYRRPEGIDITRRTRVGESGRIDILPSGYVVAPPSVHGSGLAYEWGATALPYVEDLPEPPAWVLEMIQTASDSADIEEFSGDLSGAVEGFEPQSKQEERIASALSMLSPHCKRRAWIKVGACLVDGFDWGEGDERHRNIQRGFSLWASWSKGPADNPYPDFDATTAAADWSNLVRKQRARRKRIKVLRDMAREEGRDLTEDERRLGPATVATLFHAAHQSPHGWTDPHPPYGIIEECREVGSAWVSDADIEVEPAHVNVIPMTRADAKPKPQPIEEPEHLRMMPPAEPPVGGGGNGGGAYQLPHAIDHDSHVELARIAVRVLQGASPVPCVADEGSMWRYDQCGHVWKPIRDAVARQSVYALDRIPVERGRDPKSGEMRYKNLKVSGAMARGVSEIMLTQAETYRFEYFHNAQRGVQFSDKFVTVDDSGNIVAMDPDPALRQRFAVDCAWDPTASSPFWEQCLWDWFVPNFGDTTPEQMAARTQALGYDPYQSGRDTIATLQEFAGAALLGIAPKYQRCLLLTGSGENGKSKLITAIENLIPPVYQTKMEPAKLCADSNSQEYYLARLRGVRLNSCADISTRSLEDTSKLKLLIAGDPVTGRHPGGQPFEYKPEAAFMFSANELPHSRDRTHGFWRRFLVTPVVGFFPEGDPRRDPDLDAKLARDRQAIYTWAIQGAQRLIQQGRYTISEGSRHALLNWQFGQDVLAMWASECLNADTETLPPKTEWPSGMDLFDSYRDWCRRCNHAAISKGRFDRETKDERYRGLIPLPKKVSYTNKHGKRSTRNAYPCSVHQPGSF